jgi:hypothetical protein
MTNGILIYAHNHRSVDYALLSVISGGLAKRYLNVPASLVTDIPTVEWMKESQIFDKANTVFENIIIVDTPQTNNSRRLYDGDENTVVPFINSNRYSAWDVTPYDRTLLIDGDFLIFSDRLNEYWNVDDDILIGESINDIYDQKRLGYHDQYVSDVGIKLYWATTVMFTKNQKTKMFFDLVSYIKNNYQYFADAYRFDSKQYRNDISFSIAKHIIEGFEETITGRLPPVLTLLDRDILYDVNNGRLTVLVSPQLDSTFCAASLTNIDIHVMNKQSIIRNKDKLLELV